MDGNSGHKPTLTEVIAALEEMGCRILGGDKPAIHPPQRVEYRKRFKELLPWLSHYRTEILAHYESPPPRILCPLCQRDLTEPEDRERLAGINFLCDRGSVPELWKDGKRARKATAGCPYRSS